MQVCRCSIARRSSEGGKETYPWSQCPPTSCSTRLTKNANGNSPQKRAFPLRPGPFFTCDFPMRQSGLLFHAVLFRHRHLLDQQHHQSFLTRYRALQSYNYHSPLSFAAPQYALLCPPKFEVYPCTLNCKSIGLVVINASRLMRPG